VNLALRAAGGAIPSVTPALRVLFQGEKKARDVAHRRQIFHGTDKAGNHLVRLCDKRGTEPDADAWGHWRWELNVNRSAHTATLFSLDAPAVIRMVVSRYRLSSGAVDSASALALYRHLAVEGLRAIDPELTIAGGQHSWRHQWWPRPAPSV
jgi:hypothetical protein